MVEMGMEKMGMMGRSVKTSGTDKHAALEWQSLPRDLPGCLTSQEELMTMPVDWPGFHALCIESVGAVGVPSGRARFIGGMFVSPFPPPLPFASCPFITRSGACSLCTCASSDAPPCDDAFRHARTCGPNRWCTSIRIAQTAPPAAGWPSAGSS